MCSEHEIPRRFALNLVIKIHIFVIVPANLYISKEEIVKSFIF